LQIYLGCLQQVKIEKNCFLGNLITKSDHPVAETVKIGLRIPNLVLTFRSLKISFYFLFNTIPQQANKPYTKELAWIKKNLNLMFL
jgi:hypothetical protein